jgi:hypothetical protein
MNKIILLFALIISGVSLGQFTVSDSSENWEKIGNVYAHTILYQKKDKTKSKIQYRDFQPINLLSVNALILDYYEFEFSTEPDTLDKIYGIMKDHFHNKKEETLTLDFPEGKMILEFGKSLGSYYCNFKFEKVNTLLDKGDTSIRTSGAMKEKQLDKLFGKSVK